MDPTPPVTSPGLRWWWRTCKKTFSLVSSSSVHLKQLEKPEASKHTRSNKKNTRFCLSCCYDSNNSRMQSLRPSSAGCVQMVRGLQLFASTPLMLLSPSSCSNKRSCQVPVTEWVFGEYPCKEETRYLEVVYTCATPPPPPPPLAPIKPGCVYQLFLIKIQMYIYLRHLFSR